MIKNNRTLESRINKTRKSIISTLKNPIGSKELILRLQNLSDELSNFDQDSVDTEYISGILKDLVNKKLLNSSNAGVHIFTCCSIVDVLRITAPDAPYTEKELCEIFRSFFFQLGKLDDELNPYFQQQEYLLKRLAESRSLILITDLSDNESLIEVLFETFYKLIKKCFSLKLGPFAQQILSEVISECEFVPMKVLKIILNNFLFLIDNISLNLGTIVSNSGLELSIYICENNLDKISRQLAQHFSDIIYEIYSQKKNTGSESESDLDFKKKNSVNKPRFRELEKIHKLFVQIWKYIPEVLGPSICLIDAELNAEDVDIRVLATKTIGIILGSQNVSTSISVTKINFFITYNNIWVNWLKKITDVSSLVRISWVEQFYTIISSSNITNSEIILSLKNCFHKCLIDIDEKVRLTTCNKIKLITFQIFTQKICDINIMKTLLHLSREKNLIISEMIINYLGFLYFEYQEAIDSNIIINFGIHNELEISNLEIIFTKDIPNQILSLIYINNNYINALVDICFFEKILPLHETNPVKRAKRLLNLFHILDEKEKKSFIAINNRQKQFSKVVSYYIKYSQEYNLKNSSTLMHNNVLDVEIEEKKKDINLIYEELTKIINWISDSFSNKSTAFSSLKKFYLLNNSRFFHLLKFCTTFDSDYDTVVSSIKEILSKINDQKNIKHDNKIKIAPNDFYFNIKLFLYRSSIIVYNKINVHELIDIVKKEKSDLVESFYTLLNQISITAPEVFKDNLNSLLELIFTKQNEVETKLSKFLLLKSYYTYLKTSKKSFENTNLEKNFKDFIYFGSPKEAKFSIKILSLLNDPYDQFQTLFNLIYPLDLNNKNFASHLSVLSEIFKLYPSITQNVARDLTSLLIEEVFLKNRNLNDEVKKIDWVSDTLLDGNHLIFSSLNEKKFAMEILTNRIIGIAKNIDEQSDLNKQELISNSQHVFKLLISFIGNKGEILTNDLPTWPTPESFKLKIRLLAGLCLLKLSKYSIFSTIIDHNIFKRLASLIMDSSYNVRLEFLFKLQDLLFNETISERFLSIIFFIALEKVTDLKQNVTLWIKLMYKKEELKKSIKFEKSIVRIIHIIAYHDDYDTFINKANEIINESDKKKNLIQGYIFAIRVISYFIKIIIKSENASLLFYLSSRIKEHKCSSCVNELIDSESLPQKLINLYTISELSNLIIKTYCEHKNWPMHTWPGNLTLPTDLFQPLENIHESKSIVNKIFVSEDLQNTLKIQIKKFLGFNNKRINDAIPKINKIKKNSKNSLMKVKPQKKVSSPKASKKNPKKVLDENFSPRKSKRIKNVIHYEEKQDSTSNDESQ